MKASCSINCIIELITHPYSQSSPYIGIVWTRNIVSISMHTYVMSCYCDCVVHSCICLWYFLTYHSSNWFIVPLFPGHLSHTLHAAGPESRRLLLPPLPKNDGWGKGKVTWQVHVDWGYTIWSGMHGSFFLSAVIKWSGM